MVNYSDYECRDLFKGSWTNSRLIRGEQPLICSEMNIKLEPKRVLPGYGLYGVSFDFKGHGHRLIYIGKFQGEKEKGRFGGNIVTERWRRHLYTISMRGHRVGCSKSRLRLFYKMTEGAAGENSFLSLLTQKQIVQLTARDVGCQASLNRLLFSYVVQEQLSKQVQSEVSDVAKVCGCFKFHYWRVTEQQPDSSVPPKPKVDLKAVEDQVIGKYSGSLPVNKEFKWTDQTVNNFNPNDLIDLGSTAFTELSSDIKLSLGKFEALQH